MQELKFNKEKWEKVSLGDIVFEPKETAKNIIEEGFEHIVGLEHIDSDDIHLRKSFSVETETTFTKVFRKGDILFGRRRAYLKKAAQATFDGVCSGDITVLRAKENIDSRLLPFIIHNEKFFDYAVKHSAGGLSPRVKFKDLANYEFLLPPKEQQAELADLLWAMDEVIEKDFMIIEKLEVFLNSRMKLLVADYKNDFVKLSDLFDINTGNKNAQDSIQSGKYPFFTRAEKTAYLDTYDYDDEALFLPGEGHYLIKHYKGKYSVHQRTYRIISILKDLNLEFYRLVIQSKVSELYKTSVGSTVNSLRKPIIENLMIPKIVGNNKVENELLNFEKNITNASNKLQSSKQLQKSLINQIF